MTSNSDVQIRPLKVALRGEQGSIAMFECVMPSRLLGKVCTWATCGNRKRFPVSVSVVRDEVSSKGRVLIAAVQLPANYTACTFHVLIRDGLSIKSASCRIPDSQFREFAPASRNPENDYGYHDWFLSHRPNGEELARQRQASLEFALRPLISVVTPIFRTPESYLRAFIDSVLAQTYERFELILVNVSGDCREIDDVLACYNDPRLRIITAPNKTIPENTNVGIREARGDYIAFIDHDDFIEPDAFYHYAKAINDHPYCDLLFCDEDLWHETVGGGRFCGARLKFGWNPEMLLSYNYVCHMLMVSRWAIDRTERSGAGVNGAQDYDLTLKVSEIAREICHIPRVLYHWRTHPASTALNRKSKPYADEAGRLAVQGHFDRIGFRAKVAFGSAPFSYRVEYEPICFDNVSLVVYGSTVTMPVIQMEEVKTSLGQVELIACGKNSLNQAVAQAKGKTIVVLSDSASVVGLEWLDELVKPLSLPEVACCAPLLIDSNDIVRSAGLAMAADGGWHHFLAGYPHSDVGYLCMLEHIHDISAAAAQCFAFQKDALDKAGCFNESLEGDWLSIDFCARLYESGYRTVLNPDSLVYVSESIKPPITTNSRMPNSTGYQMLVQNDPYGESRIVNRDGDVRLSSL